MENAPETSWQLFILLTCASLALGWCFCEAYITGPDNHRREGREEVAQQLIAFGLAKRDVIKGEVVLIFTSADTQPRVMPLEKK